MRFYDGPSEDGAWQFAMGKFDRVCIVEDSGSATTIEDYGWIS